MVSFILVHGSSCIFAGLQLLLLVLLCRYADNLFLKTALKPSLKEKYGKTNILSICGVTVFLVAMPMAAYFSYRGSPEGMAQNVLVSIPTGQVASTVINLCMFVSCLFTYPIITPPLNEIIEGNCYDYWKRKDVCVKGMTLSIVKNKTEKCMFVTDTKRFLVRVIQTVCISLVAYFFPYFEKIISLDILLLYIV